MITNAPQDVYEMLEELIERRYPLLLSFGVTITAQMSQTKNGLKQHGYPVCMTVKPTTEKDRVVGLANGSIPSAVPLGERNGTPPPQAEDEAEFRRKLAMIDGEVETLRVNNDKAHAIALDARSMYKLAVKQRKEYILKHFESMPLFDPPVKEKALESVADAAGEVS